MISKDFSATRSFIALAILLGLAAVLAVLIKQFNFRTEATSLVINGSQAVSTSQITLQKGWNLLALRDGQCPIVTDLSNPAVSAPLLSDLFGTSNPLWFRLDKKFVVADQINRNSYPQLENAFWYRASGDETFTTRNVAPRNAPTPKLCPWIDSLFYTTTPQEYQKLIEDESFRNQRASQSAPSRKTVLFFGNPFAHPLALSELRAYIAEQNADGSTQWVKKTYQELLEGDYLRTPFTRFDARSQRWSKLSAGDSIEINEAVAYRVNEKKMLWIVPQEPISTPVADTQAVDPSTETTVATSAPVIRLPVLTLTADKEEDSPIFGGTIAFALTVCIENLPVASSESRAVNLLIDPTSFPSYFLDSSGSGGQSSFKIKGESVSGTVTYPVIVRSGSPCATTIITIDTFHHPITAINGPVVYQIPVVASFGSQKKSITLRVKSP